MHKKHSFFLFCLTVLALSCEPSDTNETQRDFSCIQLFDVNGQALGTHGNCSSLDDWGAIPLTPGERALLDFSDTVSLAGTASSSAIKNLFCFPIPVRINDPLFLSIRSAVGNEPVKVKFVFVDETLTPLAQYALQTTTNKVFAVPISAGTYHTGQYYRVYYRVSVAGNENLFEGRGNFLVCKTNIVNGLSIEMDCP